MSQPSASQCLACRRPQAVAGPGGLYTGESAYGLRLRPFLLCDACVDTGFEEGVCAACKAPDSDLTPANAFVIGSLAGRAVAPFWLCNEDAPLAGPDQGLTDTLKDDLAEQNGGG